LPVTAGIPESLGEALADWVSSLGTVIKMESNDQDGRMIGRAATTGLPRPDEWGAGYMTVWCDTVKVIV
jgi:hypothetical protein